MAEIKELPQIKVNGEDVVWQYVRVVDAMGTPYDVYIPVVPWGTLSDEVAAGLFQNMYYVDQAGNVELLDPYVAQDWGLDYQTVFNQVIKPSAVGVELKNRGVDPNILNQGIVGEFIQAQANVLPVGNAENIAGLERQFRRWASMPGASYLNEVSQALQIFQAGPEGVPGFEVRTEEAQPSGDYVYAHRVRPYEAGKPQQGPGWEEQQPYAAKAVAIPREEFIKRPEYYKQKYGVNIMDRLPRAEQPDTTEPRPLPKTQEQLSAERRWKELVAQSRRPQRVTRL